MTSKPHHDSHAAHEVHVSVVPQVSFWRKLGGGSLSISLLVHAIVLAVGVVWVFRVIQDPQPEQWSMPHGGGDRGGDRGAQREMQKKRQAALMPSSPLKRVVVPNAITSISMPPQEDTFGEMNALNALQGDGISGQLGKLGPGSGPSSMGPNMNPGMGPNARLFGMPEVNNRLSGTIYDLTQLKDGRPSEFKAKVSASNCAWQDPWVSQFVKRGMPDSMLEKFYRGPYQLGVHQILIPCSKDLTAPKAFGAEGKMSPGAWIIVYKGRVCAPESGHIRFCGTADNYIGLRFDKRNVLYYASGRQEDSVIPFSQPKQLPGMRMAIAYGDWVRVEKGRWYDMEILIGDAGGVFSANLFYERKYDEGKKIAFRTEALPWDEIIAMDGKFFPGLRDVPVDLDPQSPVWECKPAHGVSF